MLVQFVVRERRKGIADGLPVHVRRALTRAPASTSYEVSEVTEQWPDGRLT